MVHLWFLIFFANILLHNLLDLMMSSLFGEEMKTRGQSFYGSLSGMVGNNLQPILYGFVYDKAG